jgi:phytanoyl-CoA hydroxylase
MTSTLSLPVSSLATAYQQAGYVHLGRVMDEQSLMAMRSDEARVRGDRDCDAHGKSRTIFNHTVSWKSSAVRDFCQSGQHLAQIRSLLGPDLLLWWTQFVTKMPDHAGASSIFPWHQDCGYLDIAPTPLTVWVALDDVDVDNGCIWIVPGSHQGGIRAHGKVSADSWHLSVAVPDDGVAVPLKAGEAVAFTGHTLHRSLLNRSTAPRRAFFCEYAVPWAREALTHRPLLPDRDIYMVCGQASL